VTGPEQRLGALIGGGRSGTTWLGAILSSHPDIDYRFEPLRIIEGRPEYRNLRDALSGEASTVTEADIISVFAEVNSKTVKPPFLPPGVARSLLRWAMWSATRFSDRLAPLYGRVSAVATPWLVFKDVHKTALLPRLVELGVPIVYVMRDPRAVVASNLKGQAEGLMPSQRRRDVGDILARTNPTLLEAHRDTLDDLSPAAVEALLWRADCDLALEHIDKAAKNKVVFYDEIVDDPLKGAAEMLGAFGLDIHQDVQDFIGATVAGPDRLTRIRYGEIGIDKYFSVFRNPADAAQRWRETLADADQQDVEHALEGSGAWNRGRTRGLWR
jgi:hypothetical protein